MNKIILDEKEYIINSNISVSDVYNSISEALENGYCFVTMTYNDKKSEGMLMFDPMAFKTIEVCCDI